MKKSNRSAFTLIELLVVIAIIAILAGIALPAYSKVLISGKLTSDLACLHQISVGMVAYQNDNDGNFPTGDTTWVLDDGNTNNVFLTAYMGKSYKVFQSKFDPRRTVEGPDSNVSYSFNGAILKPSTPPTDSTVWNGNTMRIKVSTSKLLVASLNFTGSYESGADAWGGTQKNTAKKVDVLSPKGAGMTPVGISGKMPCLFADGHQELVKKIDYANTGSPGTWIEWDPMKSANNPSSTP